MKKEIIKIISEDYELYTEVDENTSVAEVFEALVLAIAETSEMMLCDKNDMEAHKLAKQIKEILNSAIDESYLK